ncbi:hypothetical protein H4R18_005546 [Coemansia javaensis]|uniref:Vacuolar protein sorting-associated protein 51 homolog n=1 Tax=Coemansia javaensis TaxID=2761396 RepID=A0A9W8LEN0_9FUNG|nr:hypothetical protein H4R18_005546 [Coemansia javaensis]
MAAERSRAREKLRAFYRVAESNAPSKDRGRDEGRRDRAGGGALDLDGPGFEARRFLKKVLVEEDVAGLLRVDNRLVGEVREIDRDMKTMVYENYSKFISAAETIRRIQHDADVMDAEMGKLAERVQRISAKAQAVDAQLAGRREQLQRLGHEHRLLSSLQQLFELPDRLGRLIGGGQFVEAARAWARMQPLLEHYRQLGAFEAVEKDGKELMAGVEAAIWARWRHPATDVAQGAECASLLVLLRPDRAPRLWRDYLDIQSAKNRAVRQALLDRAYGFPAVADADADADADVAGSRANSSRGSSPRDATTRASCFSKQYLPVWSSLVIGFASQFLSPAGSGQLEQQSQPQQPESQEQQGHAGRAMSLLLEARTEGTVVGLLSPHAEDARSPPVAAAAATVAAAAAAAAAGPRRDGLVVGWQAMGAQDLAEAQRVFGEHLREWAAEYEFIADSLLQLPDEPAGGGGGAVDPYLAQVDALVAAADRHPVLVRIGGLRECVFRVAERWQRQLIDAVLHGIVRDMIERLEYYFDPAIDAPAPPGCPGTPPPLAATAAAAAAAAAALGSARKSSIGRHTRNLSAASSGSQAPQPQPQPQPQPEHRRSGSVLSNTWSGTPRDSISSMAGVLAGSAQSPLVISTHGARGLAHARAVSSAFEALSAQTPGERTSGPSLSMSPSLGPFGLAGAQRLSRASTVNHPTSRSSAQNAISGARAGVLRRARRPRGGSHAPTLSGEAATAAAAAAAADDDCSAQPSRRSLSLSAHRSVPRRYRPWLVGSVNRGAPLHVFLADTESWLIQQVLERANPLLERVVQHYLDIEGSQILDDGEARAQRLPLQSAARLRQSFVRTLDACLDRWMSEWTPDAFLHASLAHSLHGSREHVDAAVAASPMAQLGVAAIADPVVSLLLARLAADFELTLAQSIYQLCEHAIATVPASADASASNLLLPGDPPERLHSLTASAPRADSLASSSGRRATLAGARAGPGLPTRHHASHAARWRAAAERLVRNFVMTVGQDISSDYLHVHGASRSAAGPVTSVSDVWLSICRWMRQVEEDTNALFYDPAFSATLRALDASRPTLDDAPSQLPPAPPDADRPPARHPDAHILSNIDRLFAERVDVFPPTVAPLTAGRILFHLAMQIIKTALEALRLRPRVLRTRAEFQQIVVDAAFVRAWTLRYAGVAPDLAPREDGAAAAATATGGGGAAAAADPPPAAAERDARAIRDLTDDWVASARACARVPEEPDREAVDRIVLAAWMATYFGPH